MWSNFFTRSTRRAAALMDCLKPNDAALWQAGVPWYYIPLQDYLSRGWISLSPGWNQPV